MKTTTGNRVCHITSKLSVCCTSIYISATSPITERIYLSSRSVALANNKSCFIHDVLSIKWIMCVNIMCNHR